LSAIAIVGLTAVVAFMPETRPTGAEEIDDTSES
jgi:hypothetical protein